MNMEGGFQAYAAERAVTTSSSGGGDVEFGQDASAASGFFGGDYKRHDDLKAMLDASNDSKKLDAMKRIIGMVAKGKDASDLFPAVVKNVAAKNFEVKKLVYVYLSRYAEEQQDLALLSISTFQKSMKDPNQLIRASALRILSSIRVPVIIPIMMLAIKDGVTDLSPYVRKAAAHAIPKLYSVDPDSKDELIGLLEKLLDDKTTLVAGSTVQAFEEVCPEKIDLIHKHYRKLCALLMDVEEWGQVIILQMLTRYARTQFVTPNPTEGQVDDGKPKTFYSDDDASSSSNEDEGDEKGPAPYVMDADHRLLLKNSKPLLNSRNAAVVMEVAQLYYHCAPRAEVGTTARALVRLLRSHREVQYVVLCNIASMSLGNRGMFEPYLKSFFVRGNDPFHVKLQKLEVLTNLASESSVTILLREFQTYVRSSHPDFAAATIQAIGRIASAISDITDACLSGLVTLLSNKDDTVVGESVVVIKKLLQMRPSAHKEIIIHMARLVEKITVPLARASILWLIGEYSERMPKIGPDVLRKLAKTFITEEPIVKLQTINLAAKLSITNPKQTRLLCQYVLNLARYDQNYDIRDRARFLRPLVAGGTDGVQQGYLARHAKKIFLSEKPAPVLESKYKERNQYQLGSLSHIISVKAHGYNDLPEWPEVAPDPSVRAVPDPAGSPGLFSSSRKKGGLYSSSSDDSSDSSDDDDDEEDSSDDEDESGEEESSSEEESDNAAAPDDKSSEEDDSSGSESEDDESSSYADDSSSEEEAAKAPPKKSSSKVAPPQKISTGSSAKQTPKKDSDLLLDLDFAFGGGGSQPVGSGGGAANMLVPSLASDLSTLSMQPSALPVAPQVGSTSAEIFQTESRELLNRMQSGGLQVTYRFTRVVSIFSPKMVCVELQFTNTGDSPLANIQIGTKKLQPGMTIQDFPAIPTLASQGNTTTTMAINFNDTLQPASFDLTTQERTYGVSIEPTVGELVQPTLSLTESDFLSRQAKLGGMNEQSTTFSLPKYPSQQDLIKCVTRAASVSQIPTADTTSFFFAARTVANGLDLLLAVKLTNDGIGSKVKVTVNCEKMVFGSMLVKGVKERLERGTA